MLLNSAAILASLARLSRSPNPIFGCHGLMKQASLASFSSARDSRSNPSGEQEGNMKFPQTAARVGRDHQTDSAMSNGETLEEHQLHQKSATEPTNGHSSDQPGSERDDPHAGFAPITKMRMEQAGKDKTASSQPWRDPTSDDTASGHAERVSMEEMVRDTKQAVADVADSAKRAMPDVGQTVASTANWVKDKVKHAVEQVSGTSKNDK